MTLKSKSTTNELWKGWKLAWYHHFTHIACAKKLRGLRQKLDALHVQNGQSLSKYQDFGPKLICYKRISFFKLISTVEFLCVQYAPFKATSSIFNPFGLHLLFSMHLLTFWAKWQWNWKALQMNSETVESWHGIIILPTWHVLKSWEGYGKNWVLFVYKMDNLFRSIRVSDQNSSITKGFHFLNNLRIIKLNIMIKHTNIKQQKKRITEKSIFKVKLFTN